MSNSSLPSSSPSSSVVRSTHASSSSSSLVLSSMHSAVIPALSTSNSLGASSIGSTLTLTRDVYSWSRLVDAPSLLWHCPVRAFLITVSSHRFTVILLAEICCSSPARDTPVAKCRLPLLIEEGSARSKTYDQINSTRKINSTWMLRSFRLARIA
jgi:hypothetical protein